MTQFLSIQKFKQPSEKLRNSVRGDDCGAEQLKVLEKYNHKITKRNTWKGDYPSKKQILFDKFFKHDQT